MAYRPLREKAAKGHLLAKVDEENGLRCVKRASKTTTWRERCQDCGSHRIQVEKVTTDEERR